MTKKTKATQTTEAIDLGITESAVVQPIPDPPVFDRLNTVGEKL